MRKSIQLVVALAVIAMMAVSCQKEGQFNPSKKVRKITTSYTYPYIGGTQVTTTTTKEFNWGDKGLLSSVNYYVDDEITAVSKYHYDKNNRLDTLYYSKGYGYLTYIYKYDGNKLSTIVVRHNEEYVGTWKVEHSGSYISGISYDMSATEKGSHVSVPAANALFFLPENIIEDINLALKDNATKGLPYSTIGFSWENGNLVGCSFGSSGYVYNIKYQYDGKKNPLYGWYDFDLSSVDVMFSKHNITNETTERSSSKETKKSDVQYKYEYSGSYPVSCKWTAEIDDDVKADFTQKFEY